MQFQYTTDRLYLKILQADSAQQILDFYIRNKDILEKREPARSENFYTLAFQQANLSCEYQAFLKFTYARFWLFCKSEPQLPIGSVCFSNILHGAFQNCMVGYKLDQNYCHRGYMQEALSFLLPIAFDAYSLHRIEAMVQPDNTASIRLLNRLGFLEEGYIKEYANINGEWKDHLLYSLLQPAKHSPISGDAISISQ